MIQNICPSITLYLLFLWLNQMYEEMKFWHCSIWRLRSCTYVEDSDPRTAIPCFVLFCSHSVWVKKQLSRWITYFSLLSLYTSYTHDINFPSSSRLCQIFFCGQGAWLPRVGHFPGHCLLFTDLVNYTNPNPPQNSS